MTQLHKRNYHPTPKKRMSKMDILVRVTAIIMVVLMIGTLVGSLILSLNNR